MAAIAFAIHILLTPIAYGSEAAGGLFAPTLILGASLGHFIGIAAQASIHVDSLMPYALVGMAALFSATIRTPITAIAMIFEMTANFNLILPLMAGSVIAYLVAEFLSPGSLYRTLLNFNDTELAAASLPSRPLSSLLATDIMQSPVETLDSQLLINEAIRIFERSAYSGFPVIEAGQMVGIVTEADLSRLDPKYLISPYQQIPIREIMTSNPQTVQTTTPLPKVLAMFEQHQFSHVPVMQEQRLVGIITHTDIIRLLAKQMTV